MKNELIMKLINESEELTEKIVKLEKFISKQSDEFMVSKTGDLLVRQKIAMWQYKNILMERIKNELEIEVIE